MLFPKTSSALLLANALVAHGKALPVSEQARDVQKLNLDQLRQQYSVQQVAGGPGRTGWQKISHDRRRQGTQTERMIKRAAEAAPASPTVTGSSSTSPQPDDLEYLVPVKIGSKTFNLQLDTGSADLWVWSKELPKSTWGKHNIYQETGKKLTNPTETWDISYVDGSSASGNVYTDTIQVGNIQTTGPVEAAKKLSSSLATDPASDGIIGFSFDSGNTCSPNICLTFMDIVGSALKKNLFTASLKHNKAGTYDFGYIDPSKYTGTLTYTKVNNKNGDWEFTSPAYSVGKGSKVTYKQTTIADTGTSYIYVPTDVVEDFYFDVDSADTDDDGTWFYDCDEQLPSFSLYIGTHKATVPGSFLNGGFYDDAGTQCVGGIQDAGGDGNLLGDSFLKSQYVVYDRTVPQLGFAQQPGLPSS